MVHKWSDGVVESSSQLKQQQSLVAADTRSTAARRTTLTPANTAAAAGRGGGGGGGAAGASVGGSGAVKLSRVQSLNFNPAATKPSQAGIKPPRRAQPTVGVMNTTQLTGTLVSSRPAAQLRVKRRPSIADSTKSTAPLPPKLPSTSANRHSLPAGAASKPPSGQLASATAASKAPPGHSLPGQSSSSAGVARKPASAGKPRMVVKGAAAAAKTSQKK